MNEQTTTTQQAAMMRLFLAVDLPPAVSDEVARIQRHFKQKNLFVGTYTDPLQVHITLKFLGDVAQLQLVNIEAALQTIHYRPLPARLSTVDLFFSHNMIKLLYLAVSCPELALVAKQVDTALAQWFEPERRPFASHATLARVQEVPNNARLCNEAKRFAVDPITFVIDRFVLKASELSTTGPSYTDIKTYLL